jgi:hypothetical protein
MHISNSYILRVAALAMVLLLSAAMAASASAPLKITNCTTAASRPKLLTLTCADGNTVIKGLRWSSFGARSAQGKGTFVTNTCEPNCAAGKDVSYPVAVKATSPRTCKKGVRVYNKLTVTFTGRKPSNSASLTRWTLGCPI